MFRWKLFEIKYNCENNNEEWISISPKEGGIKNSPSISIKEATSPDDCASATIVISASTGEFQYIPVVRCLPECNCDSLQFTSINVPIQPSDGVAHLPVITYKDCYCNKNVSITVDGTVLCNPTSGNGIVYVDVIENKSYVNREGWIKVYYEDNLCSNYSITQEQAVNLCDGEDCDVDPWQYPTPSGVSGIIPKEGGTVIVTVSRCWFVEDTQVSDTSMVNGVYLYSEGTGENGRDEWAIEVTENTEYNIREASVDFMLLQVDTGDECDGNHIVLLKQEAEEQPPSPPPPVPVVCDCDSVNLTNYSIPKEGSDEYTVSIMAINGDCNDLLTNIAITDESYSNLPGNPYLIFRRNSNSTVDFIMKDVGENTDTEIKSFSFTIVYIINGERCTKSVTGYQEAGVEVCDCNSINITKNNVEFSSEGGSEIVGTAYCDFIAYNFPYWITLRRENNNIVLIADEINGEGRGGGGAIKVNDEVCNSIIVSQWSKPYNILIYGLGQKTDDGKSVEFKIISTGNTSTFTISITKGKLNITYWNCVDAGQTETATVDNGAKMFYCNSGDGQRYRIDKTKSYFINSIEADVTIGNETISVTSGNEYDITVNTTKFHIICKKDINS